MADTRENLLLQHFVHMCLQSHHPADEPNYGLRLLQLLDETSLDEETRHLAARTFTSHLRSRWLPDCDSGISPILDAEKDQIKTQIFSRMLSSSPHRIQSQLSEAISIISKHEFPNSWPALIPEIITRLTAATVKADYPSVNAILGIANSIFKPLRYQCDNQYLELKSSMDLFARALLVTLTAADEAINSTDNSKSPLFECQRLSCRIFFSLKKQDLAECLIVQRLQWMGIFSKYLVARFHDYENSIDGLTQVDNLRVAICNIVTLYTEKYADEIEGFLFNIFAANLLMLLKHVSNSPSRDQLATTAIKCLTTMSTSVHHSWFDDESVISNICSDVVIPNVSLKDEDAEIFEINHTEFIRKDMEGGDVDTRTTIVCELLKGISTNYNTRVKKVVLSEIQRVLGLLPANPAAPWKDKYCAIYWVVSLAGGASVPTDLIDVQNFYEGVIVPELQSPHINSYPMLKAGSLKFLTVFRIHIPKPLALQLFPSLIRFLGAKSKVVHSYAASCIEKLLQVKDEGGEGRYAAGDISQFLQQLIKNMFDALERNKENPYLMKCMMQVLSIADLSGPVVGTCVEGMNLILSVVCQNPRDPISYHYLFESMAVFVRRACERDISVISALERSLYPNIDMVLYDNITELFPYGFQLLAQFLELRPAGTDLSPSLMNTLSLVISPELWKRSEQVPGLVLLLQAFLRNTPREFTQANRLNKVLEIFDRLVSAPNTDEQGFYVLSTVIEYLDYRVIAPYMRTVWTVLFKRLENEKTVKFQKSIVIFISLFLVKNGPGYLVETMNLVQPNAFTAILECLWIPNLKIIMGNIDVKLCIVAATRLICESPTLLDPSAAQLWGKMLDSIVTLVSLPEQERAVDEPEMPEITENHATAFVKLQNAGRKELDLLKEIIDPKAFFVGSIAGLSALSPGTYPQIIVNTLPQPHQDTLSQLCISYNCTVV